MFSFSLEPQVDNALFKTNAKNAKDSAQIADKCNDPAASWLRPVEELGMKRISHFWVENCAVRYAKAGRPHVRFGYKADIGGLFDYFIGRHEESFRHYQAKIFRSFAIQDRFILRGRLYWQIAGLGAAEDL